MRTAVVRLVSIPSIVALSRHTPNSTLRAQCVDQVRGINFFLQGTCLLTLTHAINTPTHTHTSTPANCALPAPCLLASNAGHCTKNLSVT